MLPELECLSPSALDFLVRPLVASGFGFFLIRNSLASFALLLDKSKSTDFSLMFEVFCWLELPNEVYDWLEAKMEEDESRCTEPSVRKLAFRRPRWCSLMPK